MDKCRINQPLLTQMSQLNVVDVLGSFGRRSQAGVNYLSIEDVPQILRYWRLNKLLKVAHVGRTAGISPGSIRAFESEGRLQGHRLLILMSALGLSPEIAVRDESMPVSFSDARDCDDLICYSSLARVGAQRRRNKCLSLGQVGYLAHTSRGSIRDFEVGRVWSMSGLVFLRYLYVLGSPVSIESGDRRYELRSAEKRFSTGAIEIDGRQSSSYRPGRIHSRPQYREGCSGVATLSRHS